MKAFESAVSSMGYFLLRYLNGAEYPEEVLDEIEMFLNSLPLATIPEAETFFKLLEDEFEESSYQFSEEEAREKLEELNCPEFITECIISTVAA